MLDTKRIKAFTLVELSIVIVIISFIVAGVSAGQALLASSRIMAQAYDLQVSKLRSMLSIYNITQCLAI